MSVDVCTIRITVVDTCFDIAWTERITAYVSDVIREKGANVNFDGSREVDTTDPSL